MQARLIDFAMGIISNAMTLVDRLPEDQQTQEWQAAARQWLDGYAATAKLSVMGAADEDAVDLVLLRAGLTTALGYQGRDLTDVELVSEVNKLKVSVVQLVARLNEQIFRSSGLSPLHGTPPV